MSNFLSANPFNLDKSEILWSGKELIIFTTSCKNLASHFKQQTTFKNSIAEKQICCQQQFPQGFACICMLQPNLCILIIYTI